MLKASLAPADITQPFVMNSSLAPTPLNVGGQIFMVSRATWMRAGFLATLLADDLGHDMMDTAGNIFIDRDPELFGEVVRLLRGYAFVRHPRLTWQEVRAEADFYQVRSEDIDALAPPPAVVLPPERVTTQVVTLLWVGSNDPRNRWHVSGGRKSLTQDIDASMPGGPGAASTRLEPEILERLGFQKGETTFTLSKTEFTRTVRIAFYEKMGGAISVPVLPEEVHREDHPQWLQITYTHPQ
uniref:Potassium channel tetramerisation-type BTB domain-containing protein n=1 Tax=Alexandrium catenella TaxID=2925 RepID=A0A7S1PJW0_ALECA